MCWTGFGCKSVWRDLSKLAVTYFCRRLSVGIDELWRTASTCETCPALDPLPYTIFLHPPPPPSYPLHPSTPSSSPNPFLPPNLALTAVRAFSFHLNTKKVRKVLSKFVANFRPLLVISCSKFLHSSVLSSSFKYDWLMNNQTRNGTSNSSQSLKADLFFLVLCISKKILLPHLYWIGFLVTIQQRFISGLNGMVIKVASHCGLPQTEYNLITLNMKEVLFYLIHH